MTQKEKIKAEIERLQKCYKNDIQALEKECYTNNVCAKYLTLNAQTKIDVCRQILSFINSLQAEPVSEDLEKEIDKYVNTPENQGNPELKEELSECALYFANWQKDKLLKDAVDANVSFGQPVLLAKPIPTNIAKDGDKVIKEN